MVPLLDLKLQNEPLEPELLAAFERVLRSGQFILGPEAGQLESEMASLLQVQHAIGVSSGTDALLLALMALEIGSGDEVLCPSFTFFATGGAISRAGARPVFVDACPLCFNVDPEDARRKVTSRTKAIIPVHLYGQSADMAAVMDLAKEHNLQVIEDAAQSLGATFHGKQVGTIGDFGAFSFFPTKNLGALGDAGLLVSNDEKLAERARLLRVHGAHPKYYHKHVGGNFRIDALQAAFLRVKAPRYQGYCDGRTKHAAHYLSALQDIDGVELAALADCPCSTGFEGLGSSDATSAKIVLPAVHPDRASIWNQFTVRVQDGKRDALREHLASSDVNSEIYYPVPLHLQECFQSSRPDRCPKAERLGAEVLSIPVHPELTEQQLNEVIQAIKAWRQL